MITEKITRIPFFTLLLLIPIVCIFAQENNLKDPDYLLKEALYKKYKREALSFDKKRFDSMFFEFFQKKKDLNLTLTKEEFYSYTIKIAIYSEKLGMLYKDQKEEALHTKQEWFDKRYSDYLNSKSKN